MLAVSVVAPLVPSVIEVLAAAVDLFVPGVRVVAEDVVADVKVVVGSMESMGTGRNTN